MVDQHTMTGRYSLSKDEIIAQEQDSIRQICESVAGRNQDYHLVDDLVQEINVILLTQLEETIQSLYETNQLKYFIARVTTNQVLSNTSPFHKTYRDRGIMNAPIYFEYDGTADDLWKKALSLEDSMSKDIIYFRFEYGLKISQISAIKGVSERYVYRVLSRTLKYLKKTS